MLAKCISIEKSLLKNNLESGLQKSIQTHWTGTTKCISIDNLHWQIEFCSNSPNFFIKFYQNNRLFVNFEQIVYRLQAPLCIHMYTYIHWYVLWVCHSMHFHTHMLSFFLSFSLLVIKLLRGVCSKNFCPISR